MRVGKGSTMRQVDRSDEVHKLAAEANLAIAAAKDPAVKKARSVLGR